MTLLVEDGTGLSGSESYISVADTDARMSNLGLTNWATLQTAEKEAALRRATQYMVQAYRQRWQGLRRSPTQALDWPRMDVFVDEWPVASNIVPSTVAEACADLAFKAAAGDLNADLTTRVVTKKVGPIEKTYDRFSPQQTRYPSIEMALSPYLTSGGASFRLVRA